MGIEKKMLEKKYFSGIKLIFNPKSEIKSNKIE